MNNGLVLDQPVYSVTYKFLIHLCSYNISYAALVYPNSSSNGSESSLLMGKGPRAACLYNTAMLPCLLHYTPY